MNNKNYKSISNKYKKTGKGRLSKEEVSAYLLARMPATKAALTAVLQEVAKRVDRPIERMLDLGAGPGTATLAAQEIFPLKEKVLIESNPDMIQKKCVEGDWIHKDLRQMEFSPCDLVVFGYSFGELEEKTQEDILARVWKVASIVVIVEPGTPRGFTQILRARKQLIALGAEMIAPCPHTQSCPMEGKDWCHFSQRLERSKEHKRLKDAELGWEDEKYSYVAFSKEPALQAKARIVGRPKKGKGHVILPLCGQEGLEKRVVTKKEKECYRSARKSVWGGEFFSSQVPKPHS